MPKLGFFETRSDHRQSKGAVRLKGLADFAQYHRLRCDGCPLLSKDLAHPKMKATGSKTPVLYILGESPSADDDEQGEQFIGRTGQLLRRTMEKVGLDQLQMRWNNCCRCRPPRNRTPERVEVERCRPGVSADIVRSRPKVVVAVGGIALEWATNESKITKWRGKLVPIRVGDHACWLYPILHPSSVSRSREEDGWQLVFERDLVNLLQLVNQGLPEPTPVAEKDFYEGVNVADSTNLSQFARQLSFWVRDRSVVAFDIETNGLRPYAHKEPRHAWLSIALSDGETTWAVPVSHRESNWSPDEQEQVLKLIHGFLRSGCTKVAHSLAFDLEWMTSIYGHDPHWSRKRWGDTMVQAYVLDERRGGLGLDFLCLQRFGFRLKEHSNVDRSRLSELPVRKLLLYNALDAKYTALLYAVQSEDVERAAMRSVYRMHMRRVLTLIKAQQVGLCVDFDRVVRFQEEIGGKITKCLRQIERSDESAMYQRKYGKALSPASPNQVARLFRDLLGRPEGKRDTKTGYSVDDKVLTSMRLPFADDVLEFRRLMKLKSTYLDDYGPNGAMLYPDGRIHTKLNDMFTTTGRLSSDSPNCQNFPKRQDVWVRSIIVPPAGHVMLSADYGQIEYRVLAIASKDKRICDALRDRYDVHMDWAERVAKAAPGVYRAFGKDIKRLRSEIKNTLVFPAFYGAHSDYIARLLNMDVHICRKLFDQFWEEFAGVKRWQNRTLRAYERDGYVSCLTGRRRHAPLTRNMVLNAPIQGSASDIVVGAMDRLSMRAELDDDPSLQPCLNVHDDLTFYVPRKRIEKVMSIVSEEMLRTTFDWITVPISVEMSLGDDWGNMKAVKTVFSDDRHA